MVNFFKTVVDPFQNLHLAFGEVEVNPGLKRSSLQVSLEHRHYVLVRPIPQSQEKQNRWRPVGRYMGISTRRNGAECLHYPLVTGGGNLWFISSLHIRDSHCHLFQSSQPGLPTMSWWNQAQLEAREIDVFGWTVGHCTLLGHCTIQAAGMSLFLLKQWICARQSDVWSRPFP